MTATVPETLETTPFISVPGGTVVLPPNARPDRAIVQTFTVGAAGGVTFTASQTWYSIPLVVAFIHDSGVQVGNRVTGLQITDSTGTYPLLRLAAPATQGPSLSGNYTFSTGLGNTYSVVDDAGDPFEQVTMPPYLMLSGQILSITGKQLGAGNGFRTIVTTYVQIPTGPYSSADRPPATVATPMLV